jgi:hypothetical protein
MFEILKRSTVCGKNIISILVPTRLYVPNVIGLAKAQQTTIKKRKMTEIVFII